MWFVLVAKRDCRFKFVDGLHGVDRWQYSKMIMFDNNFKSRTQFWRLFNKLLKLSLLSKLNLSLSENISHSPEICSSKKIFAHTPTTATMTTTPGDRDRERITLKAVWSRRPVCTLFVAVVRCRSRDLLSSEKKPTGASFPVPVWSVHL